MPTPTRPALLCILDGWGHADPAEDNAISRARTPNWDRLTSTYPQAFINASELHVGLPEGQMGNSEVGHMNIGSGRVVMQDLPRIDAAIEDGSLARHPALTESIRRLKQGGGAFHLLGLLSPGGVHAHQQHMTALANIISAEGVHVLVHVVLDGRDTPPKSALDYLAAFRASLHHPERVHIATISGRYFAMDRDKRWDRVQKAYNAIMDVDAPRASSAEDAIRQSYAQGVTDEFIPPTIIGDYAGAGSDDVLLMANFRADRAREILTSLLDPAFDGFTRERIIQFSAALGMVEYSEKLNPFLTTLFPPEKLEGLLGEAVADAGLKQLRIAETEKYAHVTFFFNGGREAEFPGEERILIPSPNVATYDLKPEMSAYEVTEQLEAAIASNRFALIVVNYANTDMVGHTGNIDAAIKAVEAVDACVGRVADAVLKAGGSMLITADHGNAERMHDEETHQAHTAHTLNLVPALLVGDTFRGKAFDNYTGKLADIAPTLLELLGLPKPKPMTGQSLLSHLRG